MALPTNKHDNGCQKKYFLEIIWLYLISFRDENVECVTFHQPLSRSATFSLYDSPSCVLASLWVKSRAEKAIVAQMEKWSHMLSISHHITLMIP